MKIIILGAGRIGQAVADSLVLERNDITVIDRNQARLTELESRYDLRGVQGDGTDPAVLAEAGANDTDLLVACAAADETNLVACKLAHMVFEIPMRIARVHSAIWLEQSKLLGPDGFAVDRCLRPEESLTRYLAKLVQYPQAMQVREFAGGRAIMTAARVRAGAPMAGCTVAQARALHADLELRIVAIYRRFADGPDRFIAASGTTRIEADDEVFTLSNRDDGPKVLELLTRPSEAPAASVRRIMVVDGGIVAVRLAQTLVHQRKGYYRIKVVERDYARSEKLAAELPDDALLFNAEATDEDFLEQENVEEVDLLLALSQNDENNILTCLLAKRMGAKRVLALINQRSYADLMHGTQIDIALTPAQAMLGELMSFVRQGEVQAVHSLRRGVAEALEIVVRGDRKTSSAVGKKVGELKLPRDVHIGLIVRGLESQKLGRGDDDHAEETEKTAPESAEEEPTMLFPNRETVIENGDHIVFFLPHKRLVREVERVFSVRPLFF